MSKNKEPDFHTEVLDELVVSGTILKFIV